MRNLNQSLLKKLDKFSNIFTQLGMVLVLFVVYILLEHKTEQTTVITLPLSLQSDYNPEIATEKLFKKEEKKKVVKKVVKKQPKTILEVKIKKVDNDELVKEIFVDEPIDDNPEIKDLDGIDEVKIGEDIVDDIPIDFVQNAPVFRGCEGLSKEENKKCFDKKMKRFVQRNFNNNIANELGLEAGKKSIGAQFIIDNNGDVVDIRIKAPHKELEKETKRIIKKLPKFKPGKQNNKNVKVRYFLPINFSVEY